jgi:hypothetical protein
MVFFRAGACDLDAAARALTDQGLRTTRDADRLHVVDEKAPAFTIVLVRAPHVGVEAREIGYGTPHESALRECDARFEISVDDLDAALDEMNTLMMIQGALQDAARGYLFLPWNGTLNGPDAS